MEKDFTSEIAMKRMNEKLISLQVENSRLKVIFNTIIKQPGMSLIRVNLEELINCNPLNLHLEDDEDEIKNINKHYVPRSEYNAVKDSLSSYLSRHKKFQEITGLNVYSIVGQYYKNTEAFQFNKSQNSKDCDKCEYYKSQYKKQNEYIEYLKNSIRDYNREHNVNIFEDVNQCRRKNRNEKLPEILLSNTFNDENTATGNNEDPTSVDEIRGTEE